MAWTMASVAQPGQYLYAVTVSGLNLDLFGTVSNTELMERLRGYVTGASILSIQVQRGLLTGEIRVFARAEQPLNVEAFGAEVEAALSSFWSMAAVRVNAYVSDSLEAAIPAGPQDNVTESIRWIAVAVIAAAVVIGLVQLRKATS